METNKHEPPNQLRLFEEKLKMTWNVNWLDPFDYTSDPALFYKLIAS